MKKFIALFVGLSLFLSLTKASLAVEQKAQRWVCLQSEHCWKDPNSCSTAHKGNGHMAKLTPKAGFEPIPGIDTYVVVCIAGSSNCTTGDPAKDMEIYGNQNNLNFLKSQYAFQFQGLFKADGTTRVANPALWSGPYEWGDEIHPGAAHQWLAMNFYDPTKFDTGAGGGQQQGTFDFATAQKDCVSISWDPYGRVFDAGTLEPITGAVVTLSRKKLDNSGLFEDMTKEMVMGGNLDNPQTTLADGNFSYLVKDGDYKLAVPSMVTTIAQVNANYSKAYFDIYPASTGEVIQQRGAIQHRDIPVTSVNTNTAPKMMELFANADPEGNLTLQGRVSHPLSKIVVRTAKVATDGTGAKTPYRTAGTFDADKWGKFAISLDQTKFEQTPEYMEIFDGVEIQKVDLRQNTQVKAGPESFLKGLTSALMKLLMPGTVQAQTATTMVKVEPIPRFLNGYAYDGSGKPMANATVGIYLTMSSKPVAETTTDPTGHFVFRPEVIPMFPYTLKYTTAAGYTVQTSPSKFLAQNQKYIVENKVNPYVVKDNHNRAVLAQAGLVATGSGTSKSGSGSGSGSNQSAGVRTGSFTGTGSNTSAGASTPTTTARVSNPLLLVVLLLIVLIGGVGAGIVLYMKNKQPVVPPQQW